jgi:hypothetical protein
MRDARRGSFTREKAGIVLFYAYVKPTTLGEWCITQSCRIGHEAELAECFNMLFEGNDRIS